MKSNNILRSRSSLEKFFSKLPKKRVVGLCHGCFDLIHPGHLLHFREAKKNCDILIVSITADKYLKKGLNRPIFSEETRMSFLSSIKEIDAVFLVKDPTALPAIEAIKPDFYFKGKDYLKGEDLSGNFIKEKKAVELNGGKLKITHTPKLSSTELLNNAFGEAIYGENNQYFDGLRNNISYEDIEETLEKFSRLEVTVVGDIIIDEYITCQPVGTNSKSTTISTVYRSSETMLGGSMCVARHISNFAKKVNLIGIRGEKNWSKSWDDLIASSCNKNINMKLVRENINTPHKTKFLGTNYPSSVELNKEDSKKDPAVQKLFSVSVLEDSQLKKSALEKKVQLIKTALKRSDSTVCSDFGYATVNPKVWKLLRANSKKLISNIQTNSTNFGFNLANKYKKSDLICIDELEARLIAKHPEDSLNSIINFIQKTTESKNVLITRGIEGLMYKELQQPILHSPALTYYVVDPVGAGDAVLSSVGMGYAAAIDRNVLGFLGSVFGAIACQNVGNRESVTKEGVLNLSKSILS